MCKQVPYHTRKLQMRALRQRRSLWGRRAYVKATVQIRIGEIKYPSAATFIRDNSSLSMASIFYPSFQIELLHVWRQHCVAGSKVTDFLVMGTAACHSPSAPLPYFLASPFILTLPSPQKPWKTSVKLPGLWSLLGKCVVALIPYFRKLV